MAVPAKIVLKSTTKMSLSDRFTAIQKMRPPPPSPQEVRAQMAATQQSTQQNRRLAQQMANRPSVRAALGNGQPGPPLHGGGQQRSLKQRLGPSNVKARLTLSGPGAPGGRGMRGRGRGRGRGGPRGGGGGGYEMMNGSPPRGRGGRPRGRGFNRGRGAPPRWRDDDSRPFRGRGGFGRPDDRYRGRGGGAPRGRGSFQRGGRGGMVRGRGGRGRGRGQGYSKETLDNQLEEYMTMTKSHLNQELDAYMADAD